MGFKGLKGSLRLNGWMVERIMTLNLYNLLNLLNLLNLFFLNERNKPQQQNCANDRGYKCTDECAAPANANPRQYVAADKTADDTDNKVNDKAEARAFHNLAGKEASQSSDNDTDNNVHMFGF